jgi:hypothetical protein
MIYMHIIPHTEETRKKISDSNKGKIRSEEVKENLRINARTNPNYGMKGKHHTNQSLQKMRNAKLGKKNTEESKKKIKESMQEYYKNNPDARENQRIKHLGKKQSKETLEKKRIARIGFKMPESAKLKLSILHKGIPISMEARRKNSIAHTGSKHDNTKIKKRWEDPIFATRMRKAFNKGLKLRPNKEEIYIDAILQLNFPKEWKYVGDGKLWIEGKNPDFTNINGQKIVIEYNGFRGKTKNGINFGHTPEKDKAKSEHYAKYGLATINLYPEDIKSEIELINKIKEGCKNHVIR